MFAVDIWLGVEVH